MFRVCLIGAGSVKFTTHLLADIFSRPEAGDVEVRLHDLDAGRLAVAESAARAIARESGAAATIGSFADRRAALDAADVVVNTVLVGGIAHARIDLEAAESVGLRQTVGDTIGVGGIFRGLRTFPVLKAITDDMGQVCPGALLLNYTNPMAMSVGFVARSAPSLRVAGLCHSVTGTVTELCEFLGVSPMDVVFRSTGVNHQAWILALRTRSGVDLLPDLDRRLRSADDDFEPVRSDMYRRFGFFPTESSKHSSEYLPWYLRNDDERLRLSIPTVADRIASDIRIAGTFDEMRVKIEKGVSLDVHPDGIEYAPRIIASLMTGQSDEIQVNVPNFGLVDNLPAGSTVEVTASVDGLGIHPWHMGALPAQCAALNRAYLNVVDLTIEAAITENPRLIRQAAMLDPNAAATLTVDQIWELCNTLSRAHGDLLPDWARVAV